MFYILQILVKKWYSSSVLFATHYTTSVGCKLLQGHFSFWTPEFIFCASWGGSLDFSKVGFEYKILNLIKVCYFLNVSSVICRKCWNICSGIIPSAIWGNPVELKWFHFQVSYVSKRIRLELHWFPERWGRVVGEKHQHQTYW